MGTTASRPRRFCGRPEADSSEPYTPQFDVAPRRCFKFVSYERRDVQCGSGRAEVTENALNLYSLFHSETVPLNCIRRYGFESKCFMFETGQRCPSGEAIHRIWMEKAEDIMIELDRTLAWRRQMLEKALMLEEEAAKEKDLKDPENSTLLQRRAAMLNDYVTEPVAERRRKLRKRRERDQFVSSDTDSRSDLERAVANSSSATTESRLSSSAHGSPRSGSLRSRGADNLSSGGQSAKAPSPVKHRHRLKGESSTEVTSNRHRSHRPPRARSRHSNSFKPGMTTHFESSQFGDAHSPSMDTLDFSASDVGATEDCSATENCRSPSTSTNELEDILSFRSQQFGRCVDVTTGFASTSPHSTQTIVPSPCSVLKDVGSPIESDSDKTLCAASPSSTDGQFSPSLPTSSDSTEHVSSNSRLQEEESREHSCSIVCDNVDSVSDLSESGEDCTPPGGSGCDHSYLDIDPGLSSAVTLCSSAATLHESSGEMQEVTESPPLIEHDTLPVTSMSAVQSHCS